MKNRIELLRKKLTEKNIDAILISNFYNILYLTGFKTLTTDEREGFAIITQKNVYLMTDSRYVDEKLEALVEKNKLEFCLIEPGKGLMQHITAIIEKDAVKKLGFESEDLKYFEYDRIKHFLTSVELVPVNYLVMPLRDVKDIDEIARTKKACEIGDECLKVVSKIIKEGTEEREVAFKIEMWLKEQGHDMSFDPIVAYDSHAAIAHYNTKEGSGKVKKGSVILIDMGVKYKDYCSDITRMFFFGKPTDEIANVYQTLLYAQKSTIAEINKDTTPEYIDNFCRDQIVSKGLPNFAHSLGHGVGLEIHEYPKVSMYSKDLFIKNQIYTIEPGVYIQGKYGMRVEDTVLMKENSVESLTCFLKDLLILE